MKGIFGSLFSEGLIKKGAAMLGFNMPSWAGTAIDIAVIHLVVVVALVVEVLVEPLILKTDIQKP